MNRRVASLMFHSVGAERSSWAYRYLSESVEGFEAKLRLLLERGCSFVFHEDVYRHMRGERLLPEGSVLLTFDDGFLDNWTVVFPILERLGVRFTVYVSREFIDPTPECRPTLADVWKGRASVDAVPRLGYLSWGELRAMTRSGLVDIQSHTSTHTWWFTADQVVDFLSPANQHLYPWIWWNVDPATKPFWMMGEPDPRLYGTPVFENRRAMVAHRWVPDPVAAVEMSGWVRERGGRAFFGEPGWEGRLREAWGLQRARAPILGTAESEGERVERLRYELEGNRNALQDGLDKEVRYLCWPGGAYDERLLRLAEECGYWASTVKQGCNAPGDDPRRVHRISSGNPAGESQFPWRYKSFTLRFYLDRFAGKRWAIALDRLYRAKLAMSRAVRNRKAPEA